MFGNKKGKGWYGESLRHSLASKGIKTTVSKGDVEDMGINPRRLDRRFENNKWVLDWKREEGANTVYYDFTLFSSKGIDRRFKSSITFQPNMVRNKVAVGSTVRLPMLPDEEGAERFAEELKEKFKDELELEDWRLNTWVQREISESHVEGDWYGGHVGFQSVYVEPDELGDFVKKYNWAIADVIDDFDYGMSKEEVMELVK